MDKLIRNDLEILMKERDGICLSMFLPTISAGPEARQGRIYLKNLLKEAEGNLQDWGYEEEQIKKFLRSPYELLDDSRFWSHQNEGLALFLSEDYFNYYRVPINLQEQLYISDKFYVKPLLPLLTTVDGTFYVLAASMDKARLLECTRQIVKEMHPENMPQNLDEILKYEEKERQKSFHTNMPRGGGKGETIYHGHRDDEEDKKDILRYFQAINKSLKNILKDDSQAPLIFAGVDYLFPIYREANSYKHLLDDMIKGNPDDLKNEELHKKAWEIAEPHFRQKLEDIMDSYQELKAENKVGNELKEILLRAYEGRLDTLFLLDDEQIWGKFNYEEQSVDIHDSEQDGDEDLLYLAALYTFRNNGNVYALNKEDIPDSADIAAIYRY